MNPSEQTNHGEDPAMMRYGEQDTDRLPIDQPEADVDLQEQELIEQLPDDLDPREMADSLPDEIAAEEGHDIGLDPDLAVFAAQDELDDEEDL
jgi:hypothetical protein